MRRRITAYGYTVSLRGDKNEIKLIEVTVA